MSFHFAYPNVLPKKELFIGCGRYTVAMPGSHPAGDYEEVADAPLTPNKNSLKRAMQLLAPESFDSPKVLFHRQDDNHISYQGDSLDLAWFLAHMLRTYQLRCQPEYDIWATGVVQVDGSGPHLLDVDPAGFTLKIKAFLDKSNPDLLFIVPLANIHPHIRGVCEDHGVAIHRLAGEQTCKFSNLKEKTILAVPADGLQNLLQELFCLPEDSRPRRKKSFRLALLLLLLVVFAGFYGKIYIITWLQDVGAINTSSPPSPPPPPLITAREVLLSLQQGNFSTIPDLSQKKTWQASDDLTALRQRLSRHLQIQGELVYVQENGKEKTCIFPSKSKPPLLTHRDHYRIQIHAVMPPDTLYLYLFQVDSSGSLAAVFPSDQFGTSNPVRPWQWPVTIPAQDDKWIFLDQLPATAQHDLREILYLLVTPWPARDIETLTKDLTEHPDDDAAKAKILFRLSRRKDRFPAMACIRWSFLHGK